MMNYGKSSTQLLLMPCFIPLSCLVPYHIKCAVSSVEFFARAERLICPRDCCCNFPAPFEEIQVKRILSLFGKAQLPDHPLHCLVPCLSNRGRVSVPLSKTSRRRNSWVFLCTLRYFIQTSTLTDHAVFISVRTIFLSRVCLSVASDFHFSSNIVTLLKFVRLKDMP